MEVDEAVDFFASMPNISHPLKLLKDVGRRGNRAPHTLYVLDEPTWNV